MKMLQYGTYYNLNYLSELAGGDDSFLTDLTQTFVYQTPAMVNELKTAVTENDHNKTTFIAHKLKSSCEILGMNLATSICLKLELAALHKQELKMLIADMEVLIHQLSVSTYELNMAAA
jgi:HPt (histidine-containing phosphotransfer) domain-containing protein